MSREIPKKIIEKAINNFNSVIDNIEKEIDDPNEKATKE